MRRILAGLCTAAMLLSMSGCGGNPETAEAEGTAAVSSVTAEDTAEATAAVSTAEDTAEPTAAVSSATAEDAAEDNRTVPMSAGEQETEALEITSTVSQDERYDAAIVELSPEEFEAAGFELGDSCDIAFGNGYSLEDIPYYNGYYVQNGDPVVVAYPGFGNIEITLNNVGIWDTAELTEGDTVTIRLREAGAYSAIQDSLGQVYSFDRDDYEDDVEFCNFRALTGGSLRENFLYRGASPVDNSRGRAAYTDGLLEDYGIRFILDLADAEVDLTDYMETPEFHSPYAADLHDLGNMALLDMGSAFESAAYHQKLVTGLRQMMNAEGPVYIHCMEGKDRTGFVCALLEALAGASYTEMRNDYMMTYANYYQVTADGTPEKYQAIVELYFDAFMAYLHGTEDVAELVDADYAEDAANYLRDGGMTDAEIAQLHDFICQ